MGTHQRAGRVKARRGKFVAVLGLLGALVGAAGFALVTRDGSDGDDAPAGAAAVPVPGSGEEFDGCQFVEHWDAQEILGGSVRPVAKPTEHPAAATCMWEVRDEAHPRSLQLSAFRGDEFFRAGASADDPTFEKVEGIGREAFTVASAGVRLHFLAGDHSVVFSVQGFEGEAALDEETVKAQLVRLAGRMASWLERRGETTEGA